MRAMILAAGRGERLRPLTDTLPKPLIEVSGKSLLVHQLERLAAAGIVEVVINLGWLGEQIQAALGDGASWGVNIQYSPEPPGALETAGGIVHALELLGSDPFLVVAGDILCDYPFERLTALTLSGLGHLVMVDNPAHHPEGDFGLVEGKLSNWALPRLTFSGIGLYRPALFAELPPGRRALRPVFEQALADEQLSGELHTGFWSDIGTLERLDQARHSRRFSD